MRIVKNEIDVKFTVREAQSLLMVLRRVNSTERRHDSISNVAGIDLRGIPRGELDDIRGLQMELERALLMDEKIGA